MKNGLQRCQASQAAAELEDAAYAIKDLPSISERSELGQAFAVAAAVAEWIFETVYRTPGEEPQLSLRSVLLRAGGHSSEPRVSASSARRSVVLASRKSKPSRRRNTSRNGRAL